MGRDGCTSGGMVEFYPRCGRRISSSASAGKFSGWMKNTQRAWKIRGPGSKWEFHTSEKEGFSTCWKDEISVPGIHGDPIDDPHGDLHDDLHGDLHINPQGDPHGDPHLIHMDLQDDSQKFA
jgi:hypothetical protein